MANNYFNIELPDGWQDQTIYTYMGPEDNGIRHILTLIIDKDIDRMELADFARERIDALSETLQSVEILKDEEKTIPNGRTVHEFVYKWVPVDGQIVFRKNIFMVIDGVGYTFAGNFTKKTIKTIGSEVDQIINSFMPGGATEQI
ncbi:MAG: DcrB-related protein [candidate division Zixibacteria bacterium]|nr:DcrB-related protein [candidate division Zixibacteria bacterium]